MLPLYFLFPFNFFVSFQLFDETEKPPIWLKIVHIIFNVNRWRTKNSRMNRRGECGRGGKKRKTKRINLFGGREEYKNMKNKTQDAYAKKKRKINIRLARLYVFKLIRGFRGEKKTLKNRETRLKITHTYTHTHTSCTAKHKHTAQHNQGF